MVRYQHTQTSMVGAVGFLTLALIFSAVLVGSGSTALQLIGFVAFFALLAAILLNFSRLAVEVTDDEIRVAFGRGWPNKRFTIAEITAAAPFRNRLLDGFGIRSTETGLMYNVWGLDSVLLNFRDGEAFRVGTDEPDELIEALREAGVSTPGQAWDEPDSEEGP